jgi:hypothetical protein
LQIGDPLRLWHKETAIAAAEAKLKGSRWYDSEHSTHARLVR